ncbi:BQ5605_C007g04559 [Microbotryum silenes-dioicae]|uniref:BQ5605_C007g04559 protein n=1 Tax=Microbotryum silenes-dioicae TaxID=796604 RepID=A0A2X0MUH7_9BASI|nr:BQ5605_C007g04559 [Microbotryum silenes-dioicae]
MMCTLDHARGPCFAFIVLILIRQRCMRLSDFGLINHRCSYEAVAADHLGFDSFKLQ